MTAQDWGIAAAVAGANVLTLLHALFVPWWKNREGIGRHLFVFHLVITLVLNHVVIQTIVGDYPGRQTVRLVLNWAVAAILWWRAVIMIRVQLVARRAKPKEEEAPVEA